MASGEAPPVQLNTTGVNVPFSTSMIHELYWRFFTCSWCLYIWLICIAEFDWARGLKTFISRNALLSGCHRPIALTSDRAPSSSIVPNGSSSPVTGRSAGSTRISLHTSSRSSAKVSLTELWRMCRGEWGNVGRGAMWVSLIDFFISF